MLLLILAFILSWGFFLMHAFRAVSSLKSLDDFPDSSANPLVSLIIAVKDDETEIEDTVRALLQISYPHLEVVVVNDRSQDRTPEILAKLATAESRLKLGKVSALPAGWL